MRVHLGIEEHRVDVAGRSTAALVWLTEFLAPAFAEVAPGDGAPRQRVRFDVDPGRHAELSRAMGRATLSTVDGFTRDGSFSRNPAWRADDGRTWAHEDDGDAFLGVEDGGEAVTVVVREDGTRPRVALLRVVRELATIAQLRAGKVPLHASAFVLDGRAVLVCGAKRAGKTSLLVHALHCGASFLSNDRVFFDVGSAPVARAMPTIVQLRSGTLERFPGLSRAFEAASFDRGRTIAECAPGIARPRPTASPGKDLPGITPAQLCHLLAAPMQAAAPVGALLFPRIDAQTRGVALEPLGPEAAATLLMQNLLAPASPLRHSQLFAPQTRDEEVSHERLARDCRRLADRVGAFVGRLGPDAFAHDLRHALRPVCGASADAEGRATREGTA